MSTGIASLVALLAATLASVEGDDLPAGGFAPSRYDALWEKSPFAVATPVAAESAEYALVGAAQFDGVAYASLVDKQNQDHFVVTSVTPAHGLSLVSLVRGQDPNSTIATLQDNGALLKLKLQAGTPGAPVASAPTAPPPAASPIVYPAPGYVPGFHRRPPHVRIIAPPVFVPMPPASP